MQLELAELDQVFTAESIDRGVQDTCSTGSTSCKQLVVADHHGEAIYPTN